MLPLKALSVYLGLHLRVTWGWTRAPILLAVICGIGDLGLSLNIGLEGVGDRDSLLKSLYWGEMLLPLAAGWTGVGVVLQDVAKEVLQIAPVPYWRICLGRIVLALSAIATIWTTLFLGVAAVLHVAGEGLLVLQVILGGVVSILFFGASGFGLAVLTSDYLRGVVLVTLLWSAALLAVRFGDAFALLQPFLTWIDASHPLWLANRVLLFLAACLFLSLGSWGVYRERVLPPPSETDEYP